METSATDIESKARAGDVAAQLVLARHFEAEGRAEQAVEWLRRAAQAGDTRAKTLLAMRLVSFRPLHHEEGAKWAREAAGEGSAEAVHVLALLTAEGLGVPQSWPGALDLIERAATLGHRLAARELAALCGNWRLAAEIGAGKNLSPAECSKLRSAIDLGKIFAVPDAVPVSLAPRIALGHKFLSPEYCDWLIELGQPRLQRAQVVDEGSGEARTDTHRDNSATAIEVGGGDILLALVRARISAMTRLPIGGFEVTAILRYEVGQQYHVHSDYLDPASPGHAQDFARNGQRVVTFLIYLNEGFEGGETGFPALKTRYKGRKGDALFFWNVGPDGLPDKRTLHAGLPPTRGEKWLLSQWIRYRL